MCVRLSESTRGARYTEGPNVSHAGRGLARETQGGSGAS